MSANSWIACAYTHTASQSSQLTIAFEHAQMKNRTLDPFTSEALSNRCIPAPQHRRARMKPSSRRRANRSCAPEGCLSTSQEIVVDVRGSSRCTMSTLIFFEVSFSLLDAAPWDLTPPAPPPVESTASSSSISRGRNCDIALLASRLPAGFNLAANFAEAETILRKKDTARRLDKIKEAIRVIKREEAKEAGRSGAQCRAIFVGYT